MHSRKILRILIFVAVFAVLSTAIGKFVTVLSKKSLASDQVLDGYVDFSTNPAASYKNTLLKSYDPEPNWQPGELFGTSTEPLISGESALLVDLDSGKVLFEKNSGEKMKIASITKIMTAVVGLEHKKLSDKIYVTRDAAWVGEDTMYLTTGEVYTLEELLYGLVLNSGNDAAYAIADGVAENEKTFVQWMNIKAAELGLHNTYFADPSGLDDANYSTAQDLVKLARYAMKSPDFKTIVGTEEKELSSYTHKYIYLDNQTNLLRTYPGVAGIKTGYTEASGLCLVTYAENGGHRLIGVVLDSVDRKGDMILMLDHGFGTLGVTVEHPGL